MDSRTDFSSNFSQATGGDHVASGPGGYSKDVASALPGEEAEPTGRTPTSGFERNPASMPFSVTPAGNSGTKIPAFMPVTAEDGNLQIG